LTGRKLPRRRRFLDSNRAASANSDLNNFAANSDLDKKGSKAGEAGHKPLHEDDNLLDPDRCYEEIVLKRFPERLAYIASQVENELKDEN